MATTAHDPSVPTQTHHEVTRDVVNTLSATAGKGYYIPDSARSSRLLAGRPRSPSSCC